MSDYILDTSAWIALVTKEPGTDQIRKKIKSARTLLVPWTVFEEIGAILHHRFSKKDALASCSYLSSSKQCQIVTFNTDETAQLVYFWETLPKYIDLVDASLILTQKKNDVPILTLDKHFSKLNCKIA